MTIKITTLLKKIPLVKNKLSSLKGPDKFQVIKNILGNNKITVIDVGCNDGRTIDSVLINFNNTEIFGFEPTDHVYEVLIEKFKDCRNIHIEKIALSEKDGEINFWSSGFSPANSVLRPNINVYKYHIGERSKHVINFQKTLSKTTVNSVRFDSWREVKIPDKKIDLFKTDTQGYDYQVLQGSIESLKETKLILVELQFDQFYESSKRFYELIEFLYNHNFYLYNIFKKNVNKIFECDALFCNRNISSL